MRAFVFVVISVFVIAVMPACKNSEEKKVTVEEKQVTSEKLKLIDMKKIKKIEDPSKKKLESFKKTLKKNQDIDKAKEKSGTRTKKN